MSLSIYSLFVLGAVLTCILTPLIRNFALRNGFVDCPQRARKVHMQATPRLGGAAILISYLGIVFAGGLFIPHIREMLWGENAFAGYILMGAIAIFVIGILDDFSRLSPKTKLLGEFLVVAFVVWGTEFSFTGAQFLGLGTISFPEWLGFGLACLWIVGMANAINLVDGLDGLAAGITLMGLSAVSVVGYLAGIPGVTWFATLLIGCLLGFLVFNSRPASIFLGDCGSLTLGYLAGCLSLLASARSEWVIDGIFPILAFAIPITDCIFAMFRRILRGRSPFSPDMEHFHHRLMAKGLTHGKAVLAMWTASFLCSIVAIAAAFGKGDQLFAILVFFGMGGFILLRYLGYFRFEFFGQSLSTLIEDRKNIRTAEQSIKEAELIVSNSSDLENLKDCLSKAAQGMQFEQAQICFFHKEGKLGSKFGDGTPTVGRIISWRDPNQTGYFPRDQEFVVEFPISGRNYFYGNVQYRFMDGRSSLKVQDEVLLERIHDSISNLAGRLRKNDYSFE